MDCGTRNLKNIRSKRNELSDRIKLKKVLGLTVCSNAALDCSPVSGLLAYPAGCTIVLFNAKRQTQIYLVNTSRKAFTSVSFSRCGRYIATGECGINPAIKVWELESPHGNLEFCTGGNVIAEFVDHKYSVTCVAFSPTGKYLVSVGSQHDMIVNVFDWRLNLKLASNKISSRVSAVSFAEDGSYFVTVGNRHVKYWYLEGGRKQYKDPIPLMGRSAILGDLRDNDFCAVACGKGVTSESTYAITRQGHLVEFSSRRLLDKWVQCRTSNANCICVTELFIFVGCAEAIVRIFSAATLEYVTTLPRTHYLGVDVANGVNINHIMNVPPNSRYPDCIAMVYDEQRSKVSCVYNDHSLYIWDMRDIKRVGKAHSFLFHSTCIWGVETVPYNMERDISNTLPDDCFATCSSDDTIRFWGLEGCTNNEVYRRNIYSKELLKIIYIDDELNYVKDLEAVSASGNSAYDGRNGVRCIKISSDLQHLASGDRSGNIRVYDLAKVELVTTIEAHESEVLCLEYSADKIDRKLLASASRDRLIHVFDVCQNYLLLQTLDDHSSSITSIKFIGSGLNFQMVSCGADKSIMFRLFQGNIFQRGTNTSGKTTLYDMEVDSNAKHILTACQDRNIRVYGTHNTKQTKTFKGSHSDEGSLIKLSLDPSGIYIATSCTDKTLSVYDYYSGECMARMCGHSELVTGLKFTNDCRHLISASGDGCIFVWQIPHDMIVTMQARLSQQRLRSGHSLTQRALPDVSPLLENATKTRLTESNPLNITPQKFVVSPNTFSDELTLTPGYRLSDVGQLPQWAQRKAGEPNEVIPMSDTANSTSSALNLSSSPSQFTAANMSRPRGRWAHRVPFDPDNLRSNSGSPLGVPSYRGAAQNVMNIQTSDYNSASSKDVTYNQTYLSEDSSLDSGMETRREKKFVGSNNNNNTGTLSCVDGTSRSTAKHFHSSAEKLIPGSRFMTQSNEHDGDIEDISDGERTSSEHGIFYNNIAPTTPNDFKVTAMNEDELRKSVRRQKFEKPVLALNINGNSHATGTGTGTSDTEDEGSTPSAENADHTLVSMLGGGSESIPHATLNFLHAALPDGPGSVLERSSTSRRSISAKHNTENGKASFASPAITKSYTKTKKEELLRVIDEVKQTLQNVGHRSLRGSQSISDISLATKLDTTRNTVTSNHFSNIGSPNKITHSVFLEEFAIRRACSLSDLNVGSISKGGKTSNNQNQKHSAVQRNNAALRSASKRNSFQGKGFFNLLSTSSSNSTNFPNHGSDSDAETRRAALNGQNRCNGPAVAGRLCVGKLANQSNIRRKGGPNLSHAMPIQDDSSSEEMQSGPIAIKPVVPPRPRNLAFDHKVKFLSSQNMVKQRHSLEPIEVSMDYNDPETQVHNVINKLYSTTQTIVHLHANLKNSLLLKELENAVIMSRSMLGNITQSRQSEQDFSQTTSQFHASSEQAGLDNGDYLTMVNNCADLLSNLRMKHKHDDYENNS